MPECSSLRIGAAEATLTALRYRGISEPDSYMYIPYSVTVVGGDGLQRGYGFPTTSWSWDTLSQDEVNAFLDFFANETDAGVEVYITTRKDVGRGRPSYGDFKAKMARPVDGNGKEVHARVAGAVYTSVTISFSHLESV